MSKATIALLLAVAASFLATAPANADQYVSGYTRQNGTVVQPYVRSSPDSSYNNNYSVSPNVNPYTGQQGTRAPTSDDRSPASNQQLYGSPAPSYGSPPGKRLGW
jgi:hypothetical protein